jgi:mono/diheme cytochrome c family protein
LLLVLLGACGGKNAGPPEDVSALRAAGRALFFGRAACSTCHMIGDEGDKVKCPNLGVGNGMTQPIAARAPSRRPELAPIEYVVESVLDPDAYVVEGYVPGIMLRTDEPPIALDDEEIVAIAAFLAGKDAGRKLGPDDLARARARLPLVRRARTERRGQARAEDLLKHLSWDAPSSADGAALFQDMCVMCHERDLHGVGPREIVARKIASFSRSRMPSFADAVSPAELVALVGYVMTL